MHVAAIGDNCVDVYVEQDRLAAGGNALNVAANWARSGLQATYYGAVGDDREADVVVEAVESAGLDAAALQRLPGHTGLTVIRLVQRDRQFLLEDFGVSGSWTPAEDDVDHLLGCDWVHVAGPLARRGAAQRLARVGLRTSIDLSTQTELGDLSGIEVAFVSSTGPRDDHARSLAAAVLAAGAGVAVVTCGAAGSLAADGAQTVEADAEPISPVDTCGAGDTFISRFVRDRLHEASLTTCLAQATSAATATCMHLGGFPQEPRPIPSWIRDRVERSFSSRDL